MHFVWIWNGDGEIIGTLFDTEKRQIRMAGGMWSEEGKAVRPSGKEPKIKIYYSIKGADRKAAEKKLVEAQGTIQAALGLKQEAGCHVAADDKRISKRK